MNVFFDVDETLLAYAEPALRPLVPETFEQLRRDGHRIYIWSGVGMRTWDMERHGLMHYVEACYVKPLYDHRNRLALLHVDVEPDFVIDDYQEVVDAFGGYRIKSYYAPNPADREMETVYRHIVAHHQAHNGRDNQAHRDG